jgi:signal transduction histidine kinase
MTVFDEGPADAKVNILLVDDQPANLDAVQAILGELRQNLIPALSSADALRQLAGTDFAVVILDLQVAGLDGLETAKLIRGQERSRHTPIIFLKARETPEFPLIQAYALGAVDYLLKPLVPEVLRAKVAGFVDLFQKTQQVKSQAEQLRQLEHSEFEHKLAEAKQRWELERLREEARRKNEFLAMLAHELRNPLAPIRNAVQLLRMKFPTDEEARWAQDVIERQVEQMARMVDDLLDVSRITRGKINLQKEVVDVATVVARAVELTQPQIDARHHELTVAMPRERLQIEVDVSRMAQVLANLLNNAAKYTDEGGHIWLTVERAGAEAVLRVRDTGVGIPPDFLPRIFDLFAQAERSLERTQGGLGIGLTLVRNLVEMHGGTIQAFSAGPGQGSEFVVRLPAHVQVAAQAGKVHGTPEHRPAPPPLPRRILIVDDNVDSAKSLAALMTYLGHDVQVAHDGRDALLVARACPPDVILLDIGLPGMDGLEVARRVRNDLGMDQVLLVAMTGYGQMEDRRRSQQAGFNAHLVKPVALDRLNELLAHPEMATRDLVS